jgi:hypothetical protein
MVVPAVKMGSKISPVAFVTSPTGTVMFAASPTLWSSALASIVTKGSSITGNEE